METATNCDINIETIDNAMETEKVPDEIATETSIDEIEAADTENQQSEDNQQRQDFTSETYKIEITNMGKFAFGVCNSIEIFAIGKMVTVFYFCLLGAS